MNEQRFDIATLNERQQDALVFAYTHGYVIAPQRGLQMPHRRTCDALRARGLVTIHAWGIHILTGEGYDAAEDVMIERMRATA